MHKGPNKGQHDDINEGPYEHSRADLWWRRLRLLTAKHGEQPRRADDGWGGGCWCYR